ncbi:hypothetical protein [Blautia pseudococcoides]|nr:hypothetical protein [Blautia pseudococcoides]
MIKIVIKARNIEELKKVLKKIELEKIEGTHPDTKIVIEVGR